MVMATGEAKVTDYGIAKVLGSSKLTRTGTAMGSAHYMSPEQIRRPETVDARSDIYALGCVFYEVLAGQPPFGEKDASGTESDFEIKTAHVTESAPTLEKFNSDLPDWLAQLVMQMLEKEPERRPSSCDVILEGLKREGLDTHDSFPPRPKTHDEQASTSGVFSDDFNHQADKENPSDDQNQPQKPKEDSNHMVLVVLAGVVSLIMYGGLGFNLKEIAILNACLFAGYWIISNIFDKKK
jgi:serine/threonine-protein kinase